MRKSLEKTSVVNFVETVVLAMPKHSNNSCFWPYLGTIKCKISRASGVSPPGPPPKLYPGPTGGDYSTPRPPAA